MTLPREGHYFRDIDQIRNQEYPALRSTTYLDHGGCTLYSKSTIQAYSDDLTSNLYGNPHSASPSSEASTQRIEHIRSRVLQFLKADPEHFDVVFTANATAAIRLVADGFRDSGTGFWYGYHRDSHTSLVGIRQLASAGSRCFESDQEVEYWLDGRSELLPKYGHLPCHGGMGLFAYPAQSNMNGHRLPKTWPSRLRLSFKSEHRSVYTLLDAAAYMTTAQLDLSDIDAAPDFIAFSFYKIFGFPDLGALIVRKAARHILQNRRYFSGGTVDMVISIGEQWHARKENQLHEQLEDGTLPFHNIIALDSALAVHEKLYNSMTDISQYTTYLAKILYVKMSSLKHANGIAVCEIYKDPSSEYGDGETQGPTIAFNIHNSQGGWVGKSSFEQQAIQRNIHLRTGGVCNSGGIATSLDLAPWEMRRNFSEGMRCGDDKDLIQGKPTGIIRVSLGAMSSLDDIQRFTGFIEEVYVEKHELVTFAVPNLSVAEAHCSVGRLQVFPIQGCPGWQIPSTSHWPISERGLAWDNEWCLVHHQTGKALNPREHLKMALLQPSLHLEEGFLAIHVQNSGSTGELRVSLWESPPSHTDSSTRNSDCRLTDLYLSTKISEFFSEFLGVSCTLARYLDYRRTTSQRSIRYSQHQIILRQTAPNSEQRIDNILPATQSPQSGSHLVVSSSAMEDPQPNVLLFATKIAHPERNCTHIRVGNNYFECLPLVHPQHSDDPHTFCKTPLSNNQPARLRLLRNPMDVSPGAQNPTIRVGDLVKMFVGQDESNQDPGLLACLACSRPVTTISGNPEHRSAPERTDRSEDLSMQNRNLMGDHVETKSITEIYAHSSESKKVEQGGDGGGGSNDISGKKKEKKRRKKSHRGFKLFCFTRDTSMSEA
ncbi:MAG: hypothetical protein M1827_006029 [Pycnora praestabilis]|nr:MAG: hypothetical protein M1827_006029 [Pycnora praestabilis]